MSLENYLPDIASANNPALVVTSAVFLSPLFAVWVLSGKKIEDVHRISLIIATSATVLANVCLGANIGWMPGIYSGYPVWYIRYISRMIHGPPVLLCLFEFTRTHKIIIYATLLFYPISLFFYFAGECHTGWGKWGLYAIGVLTLHVISPALVDAPLKDKRYRPLYARGVNYIMFIWSVYLIHWPLYEGMHVISPFSDMVLGGVLDFASGPGFVWLLIGWVKEADSEAVQEVATAETKSETKEKVA